MLSIITSMSNNVLMFLANLTDDGPDFSGLSTTVVTWLNAFLIPVFIIIGGLSIYKLISLGWKIAHSADNPDERRNAIVGVCWWAVGLVLCVAAPVLINVLLPALIKASGGYKPPKT